MVGMGAEAEPLTRGMPPLNKRIIDPNDPRFVTVSSVENSTYNCIAWALGARRNWWEPHREGNIPQGLGDWPEGLPHDREPGTLRELFRREGFVDCEDGSLDPALVKIALYWVQDDVGSYIWTHAARQLKTGLWTSKLGSSYEVTHRSTGDLEGELYGAVYAYMAKARRGDDP